MIATLSKQKLQDRCFLWLFQILNNNYFVELLRTAVSKKQMNYRFNLKMVILKTHATHALFLTHATHAKISTHGRILWIHATHAARAHAPAPPARFGRLRYYWRLLTEALQALLSIHFVIVASFKIIKFWSCLTFLLLCCCLWAGWLSKNVWFLENESCEFVILILLTHHGSF